jgi:hypothetical protein
MVPRRLAVRNLMVVLFTGGYGYGPRAYGIGPEAGPVYVGVRGFLSDRALPGRFARQARAFDTGCTLDQLIGVPAPAPPERRFAGLNPIFSWSDRYQGEEPVGVAAKRARQAAGRGSGADRYVNYSGFPNPMLSQHDPRPGWVGPRVADPEQVEQIKLMVNTTAVAGGGIVRAIVPRSAPFVQLDHFAYRDPNTVCQRLGRRTVGAIYAARWIYVRLRDAPIEGWVPYRSTLVAPCGRDELGQAPPLNRPTVLSQLANLVGR